jgi:hypothetical protein
MRIHVDDFVPIFHFSPSLSRASIPPHPRVPVLPAPARSHLPLMLPHGFAKRLGLFEVGRVKPLAELARDLRRQLAGCCPFTLMLPQSTQAHRGA